VGLVILVITLKIKYMKSVQTNCIQTQIDDFTGECVGYRLTLPVPVEFAETVKQKSIVIGRNKVHYFIFEHKDFKMVMSIKMEAQMKITALKIKKLQERYIKLMHNHSRLY
jgi:hypothetical protein